MGQKLSSKLLFIISIHQIKANSDGFYIFYISQGSVATQLRYSGILVIIVTTLLRIFHRMHQ